MHQQFPSTGVGSPIRLYILHDMRTCHLCVMRLFFTILYRPFCDLWRSFCNTKTAVQRSIQIKIKLTNYFQKCYYTLTTMNRRYLLVFLFIFAFLVQTRFKLILMRSCDIIIDLIHAEKCLCNFINLNSIFVQLYVNENTVQFVRNGVFCKKKKNI